MYFPYYFTLYLYKKNYKVRIKMKRIRTVGFRVLQTLPLGYSGTDALFGILDGIRTRAKPVKGAGANRYTTRTKFWWDRWDSNP